MERGKAVVSEWDFEAFYASSVPVLVGYIQHELDKKVFSGNGASKTSPVFQLTRVTPNDYRIFTLGELLVKVGCFLHTFSSFFRVRWLKPEEGDKLSSSLTLRHWSRSSPQSRGSSRRPVISCRSAGCYNDVLTFSFCHFYICVWSRKRKSSEGKPASGDRTDGAWTDVETRVGWWYWLLSSKLPLHVCLCLESRRIM